MINIGRTLARSMIAITASLPTAIWAAAPASVAAVPAPQLDATPKIESMKLAEPRNKRGVPVDLRYQFEGEVGSNRPVTLHLAAVPRVTGNNLVVGIKKEAGIAATAGDLTAQKASASTSYRHQLSVTRLANGPSQLRVLVTMDTAEGTAHGWFSIPLDTTRAAAGQQ